MERLSSSMPEREPSQRPESVIAKFLLPKNELDQLKMLATARDTSVTHVLRQAITSEWHTASMCEKGWRPAMISPEGQVHEVVYSDRGIKEHELNPYDFNAPESPSNDNQS